MNTLFESYQSLWNNRSFHAPLKNPEEILKEAVLQDLRDELTHPRLRKSHYEKFTAAAKRIMNSNLSNDEKAALIQLHLDTMELL
ncbi:hypothetical protein [Metabacillus sp. RGM 3146]|uniref:hypothetical protein n=1 Tax=Metabacillus sp. RGM 3146 TaxID=3401092 RepID=UPI003B999A7D